MVTGSINKQRMFTGLMVYLLLLFLCGVPFLPGQETKEKEEKHTETKENSSPEGTSEEKISRLINRLGNKYLANRLKAQKQIVKIGSPAVPQLLDALDTASFRKQKNIYIALGKIKDRRAIPVLIKGYLSKDLDIKLTCRKALEDFGQEAFNALKKYISNHPQSGRKIEGLIEGLVVTRVEQALFDEISPPSGDSGVGVGFYDGQFKDLVSLREQAVPILKKIGLNEHEFQSNVPPYIRNLLRQDMNAVSQMAIEALGTVGTKEEIPFLKKISGKQPSAEGLSKVAAVALYHLGEKNPLLNLKDQLKQKYKKQRKEVRSLESRLNRSMLIYNLYRTGMQYTTILARINEEKQAIEVYKSLLNVSESSSDYVPRGLLWYNMACSYAQIGKKKKAIQSLEKALEEDWGDAEWVQIDGDMDPIREMDEFKKILRKMKKKEDDTVQTRDGRSTDDD